MLQEQQSISTAHLMYVESGTITRRHFLKTVAATAAGSALLLKLGRAANQPLLKPARLKAGSVVGIVSPAGATFARRTRYCPDAVRALGLIPDSPPSLNRYGYLEARIKPRCRHQSLLIRK